MTPERRAELKDIIRRMQIASDVFYSTAVRIGNHAFIERAHRLDERIHQDL